MEQKSKSWMKKQANLLKNWLTAKIYTLETLTIFTLNLMLMLREIANM